MAMSPSDISIPVAKFITSALGALFSNAFAIPLTGLSVYVVTGLAPIAMHLEFLTVKIPLPSPQAKTIMD